MTTHTVHTEQFSELEEPHVNETVSESLVGNAVSDPEVLITSEEPSTAAPLSDPSKAAVTRRISLFFSKAKRLVSTSEKPLTEKRLPEEIGTAIIEAPQQQATEELEPVAKLDTKGSRLMEIVSRVKALSKESKVAAVDKEVVSEPMQEPVLDASTQVLEQIEQETSVPPKENDKEHTRIDQVIRHSIVNKFFAKKKEIPTEEIILAADSNQTNDVEQVLTDSSEKAEAGKKSFRSTSPLGRKLVQMLRLPKKDAKPAKDTAETTVHDTVEDTVLEQATVPLNQTPAPVVHAAA
ncbi:hypothetical protein J3Q64DRAFT_1703245 [Phycomyces blakesleeanus]|uniref:Uncharacterized protein n=2 Tax=Phycomyces blakesleeanus TaxID=4837 RepID=A0A167K7T2_PHYB8|nr:hypothetical protein PHYBLDRAFT_174130 [Phycomyces blakesleeanus NRRL 1555(-)]OAD67438.1 hypothetical protein PHYBLDRAFT_174130 [Phycomyces blakesleeanus NRRL 1555(-)]|eukprot:XP_018285478.1 hypothetical protein PHYBLDRAFT_174130 [Phycomyces blakesleeanus NRRL 1555(-)]